VQPPNDRPTAADVAKLLGATVHERADGGIDYVAETRIAGWSKWSDRALREREP